MDCITFILMCLRFSMYKELFYSKNEKNVILSAVENQFVRDTLYFDCAQYDTLKLILHYYFALQKYYYLTLKKII